MDGCPYGPIPDASPQVWALFIIIVPHVHTLSLKVSYHIYLIIILVRKITPTSLYSLPGRRWRLAAAADVAAALDDWREVVELQAATSHRWWSLT